MAEAEFSKGLEQFTYQLHEQLVKPNPDQNIVYSPLSIRTAAGMLRMGATKGSATATELDEGLRFGAGDVQRIAERFDAVLRAYGQCNILRMANRLYLMKGQRISEQFGSILESKFRSTAVDIDFGSDQAASIINSWVEQQTNHLIKDIVDPSVLSNATRLVLVNAIHFKGEWSFKFNEGDTKKEQFFSEPQKPTNVDMMHATDKFLFGELPKLEATALRLDYSACNLAMIFLLPDQKSSLPSLEKKLAGSSLESILSGMTLQEVDVKIPKFRAEFQQELSDAFKLMGMSRIFSDLAELDEILDSRERLSVSNIIHKTFIEVDEVGTEAAAATAVAFAFYSMPVPPSPPKVFHANRPFFYGIYDNVHGFLFVGRFSSAASGMSAACTRCEKGLPCSHCEKNVKT